MFAIRIDHAWPMPGADQPARSMFSCDQYQVMPQAGDAVRVVLDGPKGFGQRVVEVRKGELAIIMNQYGNSVDRIDLRAQHQPRPALARSPAP